MASVEHQFRLAEIEVNKSTIDEHIVGVFRYESEHKGKRGPIVVILVDIASSLYVYEQLLDVINACAEQTRHLIAAVDTDPMARFEKLVQRLNQTVADFVKQEPSSLSWNRINMYVLELSEHNLCFTGIGKLANLFLQKQADQSYRVFDLFGSLEQPAVVQPDKPFASLICGDIHPGDILFAGSRNFERLRDELRIIDRLKSLPPVTAAHEIRQDLEHGEIPDDFAAMVIAYLHLPQPAATVVAPSVQETPRDRSTASVERLQQEETTATAMLSPSVPVLSQNHPLAAGRARLETLIDGLRERWQDWRSERKQPRIATDPLTMTSLRGMHAGHSFSLSPERKRSLWLYAAGAIVVIGGVAWYQYHRHAAALDASWNKLYADINDRRTRAEADVIYGNEDQARQLLTDARNLLTALDAQTSDHAKSRAGLENALRDVEAHLRHEIRVDQPSVLIRLRPETAANSLRSVSLFHQHLYTVDNSSHQLFSLDGVNPGAKSMPLGSDQTVVASAADKDRLILVTNQASILSLEATTPQPHALTLASNRVSSTTAIALYNHRLYRLDPPGNMIWKYNLGPQSVSKEQAYLKQNTHALQTASAMAIDLSVYVGFQDGSLIRYLSGNEENWRPKAIVPALQSITGLWTGADSDRIVLSDAPNKRLVVLHKDGHLIGQIVSIAFNDPEAVTADPISKKIFVVDSNRILMFDLP